MKFNSIKQAIEDIKKGKVIIVVDDENRENEGDLVVPAQKIDATKINFMAKYGRGLICLALSGKRIEELKLPLMPQQNVSRRKTAFTISIEAKKGVTTGISAKDRSVTIKTAIKFNIKKNDIHNMFFIKNILFGYTLLRKSNCSGREFSNSASSSSRTCVCSCSAK